MREKGLLFQIENHNTKLEQLKHNSSNTEVDKWISEKNSSLKSNLYLHGFLVYDEYGIQISREKADNSSRTKTMRKCSHTGKKESQLA